jgi:glycosyltransferase involved in cell wall biosynthesis
MPKIVVVIPVYNESALISSVVAKSKKYVCDVIVADDCSTDLTVNNAKDAGADVVHNNLGGRGTGRNTWCGIKSALNSKYNADIVVTLDGDGQHDPEYIQKVVEPILYGQADFVIGSRMLRYYEIPLYRRFGISVITYLYNWHNQVKVGDSQSGYRAYSRKVLEAVPFEESGFGFSVETIVKIRAKGFRIAEVPVNSVYHRKYSDNSSLNGFIHGLQMVWKVLYWRAKIEFGGKYLGTP